MDTFTDTLPYLIVLSSLFLLCILLFILGLRNNKIKSLNNENENLNDQIRKYKSDISQLNKQINAGNYEYSQQYNQNAVYVVQINDLKEKISAVNDKNTSLQNEIRSLQTQIRSYEKDYLSLQGQVKTLTQQKDKLQKAYNHAVFEIQNNENKDLISEINGYKNEIAQLNKQINSGNKKYSQLYNQNAVYVVQINDLKEEIGALNDKNTSLQNEIRSQQTQIRSYEKDYQSLQGKVKTPVRDNISIFLWKIQSAHSHPAPLGTGDTKREKLTIDSLKERELFGVFDAVSLQCLWLIVEEAICSQCRNEIHNEVVYRPVA